MDLTKNKLTVVAAMKYGRDLRNKISMYEDKIYIMGGAQMACEAYNYIDKKWVSLKSYDKAVRDSLDSWACTGFVNFPKISHINQMQNDYLSDYYSNNDGYAINYYNQDSVEEDHDLYDDMDIDMDSELSISRNSFYR